MYVFLLGGLNNSYEIRFLPFAFVVKPSKQKVYEREGS
jgi:hypothetical protein